MEGLGRQARLRDAVLLRDECGEPPRVEIMIPLVGEVTEFTFLRERVDAVAREVMHAKGRQVAYLVGTMIEVPRGALTADEIAQSAEFFSFGTNDLTQTALGMSRDDSGSFLPHYAELEIAARNPFATLDQSGVGQLVESSLLQGMFPFDFNGLPREQMTPQAVKDALKEIAQVSDFDAQYASVLEQVKADLQKFGDPRRTAAADGDRLARYVAARRPGDDRPIKPGRPIPLRRGSSPHYRQRSGQR